MKVNLSPQRICHLLLLTSASYAIGQLLILKLEWTPLSAYGFGCTLVVQVNNAILKILESDNLVNESKDVVSGRERVLERRKLRAEGTNGSSSN
jgi:hypothetical protein